MLGRNSKLRHYPPDDLLKREICAVLRANRRSREARRDNALAMLRPAAAALAKGGLSDLADKIRRDIDTVNSMGRIPGAYE